MFLPFSPQGTTKNITASSTTSSVALPVFTESRTVRVYNATGVVVFISFGISTVEAVAATSMPIGPGGTEFFDIGPSVTHVAGITAAGGGTVYFTEGKGA